MWILDFLECCINLLIPVKFHFEYITEEPHVMVKINFPKYAARSDCHCCLIMVLSYLDLAAADSSRLLQGMTLFSI